MLVTERHIFERFRVVLTPINGRQKKTSCPHCVAYNFEKATGRLTGVKNVVAPRGGISFRDIDTPINGPRGVRPCGACSAGARPWREGNLPSFVHAERGTAKIFGGSHELIR